MHPAVGYEMIGDLIILGVLAFLWPKQPKSGVIFALALLLYAVMRFFVSFLRLDSKEPLLGLSTPQLVSLAVIAVAVPLLLSSSGEEGRERLGQSLRRQWTELVIHLEKRQ